MRNNHGIRYLPIILLPALLLAAEGQARAEAMVCSPALERLDESTRFERVQ